MFGKVSMSVAVLSASVMVVGLSSTARAADSPDVVRGRYLVMIAGCTDCHTPGYFSGNIDPAKLLSGSDVGFQVPGVGTVIGRNLTPDKETGLGNWTLEQIIKAFTTGFSAGRPDAVACDAMGSLRKPGSS
ncbi:MAG: hypothetical protein WDO56_29660 [Gammaproteobacteria bacterium]